MQIRELDVGECREILKRNSLGHLACARDRQPYVVPIHFSYDDENRCLFAFSSEGQKIAWMRANPSVCLEIEDIEDKHHWTTVLAFGRYHELHESASAALRARAWAMLERREEWWLPAAGKLADRERHAMVIYRITIDRLTGRRAARGQ